MRSDLRARIAPPAIALVAIAGCAVGPDYARPPLPEPVEWSAPLERGLSASEPDSARLATWWTQLGDPLLADLVERAIAGNLDLREAEARVRRARAARTGARAGLFPTVEANGSSRRSHSGGQAGGSFSGAPTGGGGDRSL
jgi:outer membrane protein TolC